MNTRTRATSCLPRIATATAAAGLSLVLLGACGGGETSGAPETEANPGQADGPAAEGPETPDAETIADGFLDAGLPVTDGRDNTDGWCGDDPDLIPCVQWYTSEDVTIVTFEDYQQATDFVTSAGSGAESVGSVALFFAGRDTTPKQQERYARVLNRITNVDAAGSN